jgi:hypothetical protein
MMGACGTLILGIGILLASSPSGPPSASMATQPERERLREVLPNGAVILAERTPGAQALSLHLFASAAGVAEEPASHGWRHLLEHLIAKGPGGVLDARLESEGAFLEARTYRDVMQFQIDLPPAALDLGLWAIGQLLTPLANRSVVIEREIEREMEAIGLELDLVPPPQTLSDAAWTLAYGDLALSPLGSLETMRRARLEDLVALQARHFRGRNLVLVVAGDLRPSDAIARARSVMAEVPAGDQASHPVRPSAAAGRVVAAAMGEARAAAVPGVRDPRTVHRLAAALAFASEIDGAFVSYTPSAGTGVVTVGVTDRTSGVGLTIDRLLDSNPAWLRDRGRLLARRWVTRHFDSPTATAHLRGMMLAVDRGASPEEWLLVLEAMSAAEFVDACNHFGRERALVVAGGRG